MAKGGNNKDAENAARLKKDGVYRRTFRHPVTGKVMTGRPVTDTNKGSGHTATTIDCYGAIVFRTSGS